MRIPVPAIALISVLLSINASSVAIRALKIDGLLFQRHTRRSRKIRTSALRRYPRRNPRRKPRGPQPQTDAAKPTRDAHDGSTIGTCRAQLFRKGIVYSYHSGKNGERFGIRPRSANRRSSPLPFGTEVRATNVANNKSLVITITDRGPHTPDRVPDLSLNAARTLGITDRGVAEIRAEVL
jgi:rare lipoprotein A (peptidoglycan hydrolase)